MKLAKLATLLILFALTSLVAIGVGVAVWLIWLPPWGPAPIQHDPLTQLASVSVPIEASSLAWSPDGRYLAAGTLGSSIGTPRSGDVFIVEVGKEAMVATLKVTGSVEGLAFSPDRNWLAVTSRKTSPADMAPGELVAFDVPAFAAQFTAKARRAENGFIDLAWAADSKALHAIDALDGLGGTPEFRRWDVPTFTERPAIKIDAPQNIFYKALAVSPDGLTLAVAEQTALGNLMIRLFNLEKGTETSAFKVGEQVGSPRLGFIADGKTVGVFDGTTLSWWDVGTGRSAKPGQPQFAIQPAGLSQSRSNHSLSPDCSNRVRAHDRHRDFGDLGWDNRENEFGAFVELTQTTPAKTRTWRVGPGSAPAVAFSPDGTKLAGTHWLPRTVPGSAIVLWAVPK
jgi:WD40 repeat protein